MDRTYELLSTGTATDFVAGKLKELTTRQTDLTEKLAAKDAEQLEFNARDARFYSSQEDVRKLVAELQNSVSDETYKLRAQMAARLKVIVETLLVAPLGDLPKMKRNIEHLLALNEAGLDDVIEHTQKLSDHPNQSRRYFAVGFKDAAVRAVFPAYDDPLAFEQQLVAPPITAAGRDYFEVISQDTVEPKP